MFALIRALPLSEVISRQLPVMGMALILTEAFYRFHSFTLEFTAFLGTWYGLDWAFETLRRMASPPKDDDRSGWPPLPSSTTGSARRSPAS